MKEYAFEVGGSSYRGGRLSAMAQFHVARRMAPVLATAGGIVGMFQALAQAAPKASAGEIVATATAVDPAMALEAVRPVFQKIAELPDVDVEYVIRTCLSVVSRQQPGGGFSPVVTGNGQMMFDDIDMVAMLGIAWEVVQQNMAGFFSASSSASPAVPPGGPKG